MQTGSLGDIVFETSSGRVFTPQSFSMNRETRFEDHEVQGAFPRPEYLAPSLASASLTLTLRRDLGCDPAEEAQKLEEMAINGEVLRLIIAGKNLGKWTIRKVDQSWRSLLRNVEGPQSLTLTLELKEYY